MTWRPEQTFPDSGFNGETYGQLPLFGYPNQQRQTQGNHLLCTVNEEVNDPRFVQLEVVSLGIYEIKMLKKKDINDLPIQIGLFVYLNAKLTMLRFLYDLFPNPAKKKAISLRARYRFNVLCSS